MTHVQDAILYQMNDPAFAAGLKKYKNSIYILQLLLPATPTDIPVNAPAWSRHYAQSNLPGGKKFDAGAEGANAIGYLGVVNTPNQAADVVGGINSAVGDIGDLLGGSLDDLHKWLDTVSGNNQP